MANTVLIDPITRIEGHLAVKVEVEDGRVTEGRCIGEMFRGFEVLLRGRHPMDAGQITQRICGVCPISHGTASIFAQDMAYKVTPPDNGRLIRNLILGANYIQSHLIHFYHLCALDFIDIAAVAGYQGNDGVLKGLRDWINAELASKRLYPAAPFLPRYNADYATDATLNLTAARHYVEALEMRALAHDSAALFCGKIPHATGLIPGGVTQPVTVDKIAAYVANMKRLQAFVNDCYVQDVIGVAQAFPAYFQMGKSCGNFLAYGNFPESASGNRFFPSGTIMQGALKPLSVDAIAEEVKYSLFSSPSGLHPYKGETSPEPNKSGAYTWLKAPRYQGQPMEVGALARILVAYQQGMAAVRAEVDGALGLLGLGPEALDSVLGRHAARALETKIIVAKCLEWAAQLKPGKPVYEDFELPDTGQGYGLAEAPRGALGHWIEIQDKKIARYQCIVPTTWNCSPRDDRGVPGPVEQSLAGTPVADPGNPIEAARVVRSFDPCIACAVH